MVYKPRLIDISIKITKSQLRKSESNTLKQLNETMTFYKKCWILQIFLPPLSSPTTRFQIPDLPPHSKTLSKKLGLIFSPRLTTCCAFHLGKSPDSHLNAQVNHIVGAPLIEEFSSLIRARITVFSRELSF